MKRHTFHTKNPWVSVNYITESDYISALEDLRERAAKCVYEMESSEQEGKIFANAIRKLPLENSSHETPPTEESLQAR